MTTDDAAPTDYEVGQQMLSEVYAGEVTSIPQGLMPFNDVMTETLFAKVWTRDVLSIKDRRLLILGVAAAGGNEGIWKIQAKAALLRGELSPEELRETLILLAHYVGYPNAAPLIGPTEEAINEVAAAATSEDQQ